MKSAFVLAAGKGERLHPLTQKTPKPLLPIQGKPILSYVLDQLESLSLDRVVINAWHLKDQIESFCFEENLKRPFEIIVSPEEDLLGTGGGLKRAFPLLGEPPFLSLNGDSLIQGNLAQFLKKALQSRGDGVWWLAKPHPPESEIHIRADGLIQKIGSVWESPDPQEIYKKGLFTGVQLYQNLDPSKLPDQGCIVKKYWIPRLKDGAKLKGSFEDLEAFLDLGTPERLKQAEGFL